MKQERESRSTDDPDAAADALSMEEQAPAGGVAFPVYNWSDTKQISPEEQKNRLARAEAVYGAIAETVEAADDPDKKVSCRA